MQRWVPSREWRGEDAYIIGGGPSLRHFDWDLVRGKNTIGCNSAFLLGADVVRILLWADIEWWYKIGERRTAEFGGRVVGCPDKDHFPLEGCPWLLTLPRQETGLGHGALGYNFNTGSLAINLALILGARRVFLLGFDMKLSQDGRPNWHDLRHEAGSPEVYSRFKEGFQTVARVLPQEFPGREVWNVTDDSELEAFPKLSTWRHFTGREKA